MNCVKLKYYFPPGSGGKESTCNEGDLGLIPGLERSPGEGNSYPFQYSGLENSMDSIETAKSRLGLGNFQFQYLSLVAQQLDPRVGKIPWRRKWQPTAIFLPEKFHGL